MPASLLAGITARVAAAGTTSADLQKACGPPGSRSWLCSTVFRITGSYGAADIADALARPVRIALVILVAFVATRIVRHLVCRLNHRLRAGVEPGAVAAMRRRQRADTVAAVLRSVSAIAIWTVALLAVLGDLGVQLAPLLAGAGVAGVALAFGAQTMVRDFLAGIFMLIEDQYGVGDVIDVGVTSATSSVSVAGTVEAISLRVTRLRDVEGVVWHVPNGEIKRVGNKSQQWSRALLDLAVAPTTTIADATEVITRVAHELRRDDAWAHRVSSEPEVWGVEQLTGDKVVIRLVVNTVPLEQWNVARELRARLKAAFDEAGIELAVPRLVVDARDPTVPRDESRRDAAG